MESTWLDKAVTWLSPQRGAARTAARLAEAHLAQQLRGYDGASTSRRTRNWLAPGTSPNAEGRMAITTLRNRSRDLVRNNEWAAAAVESIVANWVGTGIRPKFLDRNGKRHQVLHDLWREWGEDGTACDVDGKHNVYGLQNLAARETVEGGEILARRVFRPTSEGVPLNMQVQLLEADHLDTSKDGLVDRNGNQLIQGVQFNANRKRSGYWLHPTHPGDSMMLGTHQSVFVRAENILHHYRCDRAGQVRGVPWGAPAMIKLRGLDEYQDARLMRERIAACFVGFLEDLVGTGGAPNIGLPSTTTGEANDPEVRKFEPGLWQPVPAGKKISFGNPPQVQGYREFVTIHLRGVAIAYGTTYEELTGDLSMVNFSSGRMGRLAYHRRLDRWQALVLIPQLLQPLVDWFRDAAADNGLIPREDTRLPVEWTPPPREMIDPTKEVPAKILAARGGLVSLQHLIRQQGRDPDVVLQELQEDNALAESLGLTLTTLQGGESADPAAGEDDGQPPPADDSDPDPDDDGDDDGDEDAEN